MLLEELLLSPIRDCDIWLFLLLFRVDFRYTLDDSENGFLNTGQ